MHVLTEFSALPAPEVNVLISSCASNVKNLCVKITFPFEWSTAANLKTHDDVIKWKHFPRYWRYWPFVWGIHRSPVNSPYKGQWRGVLMFSLICAGINGWVNGGEAGALRRHRAHYDVTVMSKVSVFAIHAAHAYTENQHFSWSQLCPHCLVGFLMMTSW